MTDMISGLMTMDRRAMVARVAMLIGASALPASALAAPAKKTKRFLTATQLTLLGAVADTILPATDTPGALAAHVPAKLDGLLSNWASAETRIKLTGALARIEAAAMTQKHKGFAALAAAEREVVLRPHDAAALKKVLPPPNAPKPSLFTQVNYVVDPGYLRLKELVFNLYYYSETAMTHELIYEHVPGQWQPSIKLTPQSRPYMGTSSF